MGRKCSHCGHIGHNSRTCTNYRATSSTTTTFVNNANSSLRLFGVQLDIISSSSANSTSSISINAMKKSFSMDCLMHSLSSASSSPSSPLSSRIALDENISDHKSASIGYLSDGLIGRVQERKKGVPWTEEEHRTFLIGLEKLGKGDWRGISRNYVTTRTPTQVASHAQKYFLRQASLNKKKRRSSLFDMVGSGHHNTYSFKPSDDPNTPFSRPKDQNYQNGTTVLPVLLELSSSQSRQNLMSDHNIHQKPVDCPQLAASHHNHAVPVLLHGLFASKSMATPSNNAAAAGPDLELKLAAGPRPNSLEQNKSSTPGPLLVGPITVT
ncbi:GAMYB transcription factor [Parasponia andersonii]|uniref:GAMYB transcription factor n=1 Tax=Parasponia andersonii TaxID=3476 RepID=A0A2P5BNR2_PARAD|nr:GAMYB transcription factor [Parasponia andersonii]